MTTLQLGQIIKEQRKRLGMNQAQLAMVSATGVRFISDIENGKESCQLGKAIKVLGSLGLQITTLPKGT
jgi:HTH-type transcriptional regulator / antitoxin HipB